MVRMHRAKPGEGAEALLKRLSPPQTNSRVALKVISEGEARHGNLRGFQREQTLTMAGRKLVQVLFATLIGEMGCVAHYTGPQEGFDTFRPTLSSMFSSISVASTRPGTSGWE
jgi:hypothetical protein